MIGYNSWGMMGGIGVYGSLTWLLVVIDLLLVSVWLWQQITKK